MLTEKFICSYSSKDFVRLDRTDWLQLRDRKTRNTHWSRFSRVPFVLEEYFSRSILIVPIVSRTCRPDNGSISKREKEITSVAILFAFILPPYLAGYLPSYDPVRLFRRLTLANSLSVTTDKARAIRPLSLGALAATIASFFLNGEEFTFIIDLYERRERVHDILMHCEPGLPINTRAKGGGIGVSRSRN